MAGKKVRIIGRVCRAPDRHLDGTVSFNLEAEEMACTPVEVRGRLADIVERYVREGSRLWVKGVQRDAAELPYVVAEDVIMLGYRHPRT
jgi:hypothetical protein